MNLAVPGQRIADCLKIEVALAIVFWLPYLMPHLVDGTFDRWPLFGTAWFALWFTTPFLTGLGLLFLPRDWSLRWGWAQIVIAFALAGSIWWGFRNVEM
jgi:hypothetical protein